VIPYRSRYPGPQFALLGVFCLSGTPTGTIVAQQAQPAATASVQQSIDVTTTVEPMPLSANDRAVVVLDTQQTPLLFNSVEDYLRLDPSVNIQARAGNGVQADISVRGTTFEQTLVLINGLRINDPESGHLNLDIPVPLDAIARADVLHGSGSTFYGSDAIGGAINLITAEPTATSVLVKAGFGNYGSEEQHLTANYRNRWMGEQLTGSRDTSDGFMPDRGYHSNALASESWLHSGLGTTDLLFAGSDRPYGANDFYGPYPSWERTKGWFASAQQQLGEKTCATPTCSCSTMANPASTRTTTSPATGRARCDAPIRSPPTPASPMGLRRMATRSTAATSAGMRATRVPGT